MNAARSALAALFDAGTLEAAHVVAVLGRTQGNNGVDDLTRGSFTQSLMPLPGERLGPAPAVVLDRIPFVLSGARRACRARISSCLRNALRPCRPNRVGP